MASTEDARARELAEDIAALLRAGLIRVVAAADDAGPETVPLAPARTATDVDQGSVDSMPPEDCATCSNAILLPVGAAGGSCKTWRRANGQ